MANLRIPKPWLLPERQTTPESVYLDRRSVLKALGLSTLGLVTPLVRPMFAAPSAMTRPALGGRFADRFPAARNEEFRLGGDRSLTAEETAAEYNNFYEFTTAKEKVWELAQGYSVEPWSLKVHGLVHEPRTFGLEDIFGRPFRDAFEERHYRFRCVERWSMQVPWTGLPLRRLLDAVKPMSTARWLRTVCVEDREGLPGQRKQTWYEWPYYEALRLDEARHELTLLAVGIYGHALPMQHGAPWRIVAPWKYGFKSPKSIVEIELTDRRPGTFWNDSEPDEYGFFSNVDPGRSHPRWGQQHEQDIGTGETRPTQLYNGYGDLVASMYDGTEI